MIKCYILLETKIGKSRDVCRALREIPETETVDVVSAPYDIIIIVWVDDLASLGLWLEKEIYHLENITRAVTMVAVDI